MPNLSFDFKGRTAIFTGAARGIGAAIATRFALSGANVLMVDVDQSELEASADRLGANWALADVGGTLPTSIER